MAWNSGVINPEYVAPFFRFQSFSELLSKFILGIGYDLWNVHTVRERCLLVCAIDHLIRELVSSRINSRSVREH